MPKSVLVLCAVLCIASFACPAPTGVSGRGGGGAVSPDACGKIDANPAGRKLYAFLQATAELDKASVELEASVHAACRKMARELGIPDTGPIKDVCVRVANEIDANLKVSVKSESRLVTRYTPPQCHTEIDLAASFAAKCEARAQADIDVRCTGRCGGTCNGTCSGACEGGGGGGQCSGRCDGTCQGSCTGRCEGYAEVSGSAECKASAEVHASANTVCTEPKVEVVRENVTVIDDSKFQKAMRAIDVGLPAILRASKRLELAGKAVGNWVKTGASLVASTGDLVRQVGEKGLCVGGQLAAVAAASVQIEARFSVSIEASAKVSSSCGATAQ
jgi:modification target Cys-rich repeat protein